MQIVRNGIDYSSGALSGQDIKNAGYDFCCKYLSQDGRAWTSDQIDSCKAADVGVVIIGEYDVYDNNGNQVSDMFGGGPRGSLRAQYAAARKSGLSLPLSQPIYFTLDVEPGSVPWNLVGAYLDAAAGVLGGKDKVGLYAGLDGIAWFVEEWGGKWAWQTYAWSLRNGVYVMHPKARLWQYDIYGENVGPVDVDLNKAFADNYGQTQAFDGSTVDTTVVGHHPDWFAASLGARYPSIGYWDWNGQKLKLRVIRSRAAIRRRTFPYAEPSTGSKHTGEVLEVDTPINIERLCDVQEVHNGKHVTRQWILRDRGDWIPEDTLTLDFTIAVRPTT